MTIQGLIDRLGIDADIQWAESNPNMADDQWEANHWLVTLRRAGSETIMEVPFSYGARTWAAPEAADVLDCLASDAAGIDNARSFDDWAAEYGLDTDSRRAERTYNTTREQTDRLRAFMGEHFTELLYDTERL